MEVTSVNPGDKFKCIKDIMGFVKDDIYTVSENGRLVYWHFDGVDEISNLELINKHFMKLHSVKSIHERLKDLQEEAKEQGLKIDAVIEKYVKVGMIGKFAPSDKKVFVIGRLKNITQDDGLYEDETGVYHTCFTPLSENEVIEEIKKLYKK